MPTFARTTLHDDVLVIDVDNPPVNALSPGVPEAIAHALDAAEQNPATRAIVIKGAGRTFIAGADINTLEDAAWHDDAAAIDLHDFLARIEDCSKPVVMAIHGTALGGGLEVAMAGHYRVASRDAQLGQPEVNLGIIPGAEGTQRLPRLVGVAKALDMCVTGRPISSADALAAGLIDEVVELGEGNLTTSAIAFARRAIAQGSRVRTRDRNDRLGTADANAPLYENARQLARKIKRHQTAPLKAVDAIEAAATLPFPDGCRRERELFFECVRSDQAKALIHLFFAERAASKIPNGGLNPKAPPIASVGIVGAGTMGRGIAMACANAGIAVHLTDSTPEALEAGLAGIREQYGTSVSRGRLTADAAEERLARIHVSPSLDGFGSVDLIVEAVFEDMVLKQRVFREIDAVARPGCILATNTSTLNIRSIASATSRPESVIGLHFFSPAHVMRLVEVVRGSATSREVLAGATAFAKQLKKLPVIVGNGPGFVGNRLMFPYMYETQFMVEEGATPEQVDRALTGFGMAMGIFAVDDMAGLDVGWRARQALGHFQQPGVRKPLVHDRLVDMGRLGQKRGKGWYRYNDARTPTPDPEVVALIRMLARTAGIQQRDIPDQEIVERSVYALVNEGAVALEAGVAARASDIDVIYANGYGFPAWRGGPMLYADLVGLPTVLERISAFHKAHGERWRPAPLLVQLARSGETFRELDRTRAD
jgi:3-hydroxyacyl-CoA dehydrogenase